MAVRLAARVQQTIHFCQDSVNRFVQAKSGFLKTLDTFLVIAKELFVSFNGLLKLPLRTIK